MTTNEVANTFCRLYKSTFADMNSCSEKSYGNGGILIPDRIDREQFLGADCFWCDYTIGLDTIFKEEKGRLLNESQIGHTIYLQQYFKLLLDQQQSVVIRHNIYKYKRNSGKEVLVKKPYIGVVFDNPPEIAFRNSFPEIGFICFDMFRKKKYEINTFINSSVFDSSYTYEKMYIDFEKYKLRKFSFNYKAKVDLYFDKKRPHSIEYSLSLL